MTIKNLKLALKLNNEEMFKRLFSGKSEVKYSLKEKLIGTWIDGSPIYRIVIQITSPLDDQWTKVYDITDLGVKELIRLDGIIQGVANDSNVPFSMNVVPGYVLAIESHSDGVGIYMHEKIFNNLREQPVTIFLEYTKNDQSKKITE